MPESLVLAKIICLFAYCLSDQSLLTFQIFNIKYYAYVVHIPGLRICVSLS